MTLAALALALVTLDAGAAPPPALRADTTVPREALLRDLAVLRRAWEELHPGLDRYLTPDGQEAAFREAAREFSRDRTLADTYLVLSRLAAKVRCGHTWVSFYNQRRGVEEALFRAPRLPFLFRWIDGGMIVTRAFVPGEVLPRGAEVRSVDGVPARRILDALLPYARADGGNDAKRVESLEVQGANRFEAFDVLWPLLFPGSARDVALVVRGPGDRAERTVRVPLMTFEERLAAAPPVGAAPRGEEPAPWTLREPGGGTAVLTMPTWAVYGTRWDWKGWIAGVLGGLAARGVTDLVVDLRGNEGGSDVGEVIASHLLERPMPRPVVVRKVRYRSAPADLAPYLDTWDRSFLDWGAAAGEQDGRLLRLRRDADDEPGGRLSPVVPRFPGRLWVIIGPVNSSATFEFARTVRAGRLGMLVGRPTGGNQRGINGGAFFFLRLPGSGLELDLPLIGQFPEGAAPDAGLEPDVLVAPTAEDVAAGRDVELEAVLARVRAR